MPVTVPLFVVLHAEPYPEGEASRAMRRLMLWVAGVMVVFGVIFYVVLIRGGQKQAQRMEEHRMALRKRARSGLKIAAPDGAAGEGEAGAPAGPPDETPDG